MIPASELLLASSMDKALSETELLERHEAEVIIYTATSHQDQRFHLGALWQIKNKGAGIFTEILNLLLKRATSPEDWRLVGVPSSRILQARWHFCMISYT